MYIKKQWSEILQKQNDWAMYLLFSCNLSKAVEACHFNTFTAKPLKTPISQCQACFIDWVIIHLFYHLSINNYLKDSKCYASLERDFIAAYSAINLSSYFPWIVRYRTTKTRYLLDDYSHLWQWKVKKNAVVIGSESVNLNQGMTKPAYAIWAGAGQTQENDLCAQQRLGICPDWSVLNVCSMCS